MLRIWLGSAAVLAALLATVQARAQVMDPAEYAARMRQCAALMFGPAVSACVANVRQEVQAAQVQRMQDMQADAEARRHGYASAIDMRTAQANAAAAQQAHDADMRAHPTAYSFADRRTGCRNDAQCLATVDADERAAEQAKREAAEREHEAQLAAAEAQRVAAEAEARRQGYASVADRAAKQAAQLEREQAEAEAKRQQAARVAEFQRMVAEKQREADKQAAAEAHRKAEQTARESIIGSD
jgi:hypothetical protein